MSSASGTRGAMPEPSVTVGLRSRRLRHLFEESELDADELFSRERQRELEELGHANILSVRALERE